MEVQFIDFGTSATVKESDLKKLPATVTSFEPQAWSAGFAYLKTPSETSLFGKEAKNYVEKFGLNKIHDAAVMEQNGNFLKLILMEEGEKDYSNSLNAFMVDEGFAALAQDVDIPQDILHAWSDFEADAKEAKKGVWQLGPSGNLGDEDY